MQEEVFETQREFNNRFPTKMYICSRCGALTDNPYQCRQCFNQATNFALTDKAYKYTILETGIKEEIFTPIELLKESEGKNGGKRNETTTN